MKQFVVILFFVASVAVADPTFKADDSFKDIEVSTIGTTLKPSTKSELSAVVNQLTKFMKENKLKTSDLERMSPKELNGTFDYAQYGFPSKMVHMLKAMEKQGLQKGVLQDLVQILKEMLVILKPFGLEETKVDSIELPEQYKEMVKLIEEFKERISCISSESEEDRAAEIDWIACLAAFAAAILPCKTDVGCYINAVTALIQCIIKGIL